MLFTDRQGQMKNALPFAGKKKRNTGKEMGPPRCQSDALKACCRFCFLGMPAMKQDPPGC